MSEAKEAMEVEVETAPVAENSKSSMEVTTDTGKNVMAPGAVGSITCSLHPLVIMNVSEHWTRERAQEGAVQQVIGALIGKQKGRNIEVMNSFELVFTLIGGDIVIDKDYYNMKEEQFKQVFSDLDFIGWYTTGDAPSEMDIKVHKQICEINESPILLKLNPYDKNIEHLPVNLYESVIDLVNGEATMLFVSLTYTLATEEAERIGVDHVARMSATDSGESSLVAEHLTAQHSAIKMLHSRVRLVLEYMKAVQSGQLPRNHEVLRDAFSLCHRLPVIDGSRFRQDFYNQCNDVGLMTYLGTLTKGCNDLNQFVTRFNILYDRQGVGRRMRGIFF
ncbi:COP9 signalosome complex subunit 6 [Diabrotica virgifera virgifera]|uniref:COP9 signalosome complex subunit 6 n=1 Tax=Diabrotica virgifera virgifera TaxID=50390 RepID=A0A6P7FKT8_DIAVI|nr:COP9 signalosome complex subunit 6 [Diabrotica virgifera virgifera]